MNSECSGIAATQGSPERPQLIPAAACDYATGYLAAFGTMLALAKRATEGGSWHVRVSLAQTGRWLRGLGRVADGLRAPDPKLDDVRDLMEESDSGFGRLLAVRHAGLLSDTPPSWTRPSVPLGTDSHRWIT